MVADNILRAIGQGVVELASIVPRKLEVSRRRLRSVIQDMIYIGCNVVSHAGSKILKFGSNCPWYNVFETLHAKYS